MSTHPTPTGPDDRLSGWLDGELSEAEQRELEAELARDPALRADLDALEAVVRLVREEAPTVAPPGFHQRVMARVAEAEATPAATGVSGWVASLFRRWEGFALVGVAVAALLLVVPLTPSGAPEGPPPDAEASPGALRLAEPSSRPAPAPAADAAPEGASSSPPMPTATQVVGRARVEPPPPADPRAAQQVENGTNLAWEQGQAATAGEAPTGIAPDPAPGRSARFVVSSDDPTLKRRVLALSSRYGAVRDAGGRPVEDAARAGDEELRVVVSQAELPAFARGLRGLGFDVDELPSDLLAGGEIELRLVLEGAAGPRRAAPAIDAAGAR